MKKTVRVFTSHEKADAADNELYAGLSSNQCLRIFFELIFPKDAEDTRVERTARIYQITERDKS